MNPDLLGLPDRRELPVQLVQPGRLAPGRPERPDLPATPEQQDRPDLLVQPDLLATPEQQDPLGPQEKSFWPLDL